MKIPQFHKALVANLPEKLNISAKSLVDQTPKRLQLYLKLMRLDRPIGIWLLYLPFTWSIALAAPAGHLPNFKLLALFGIGAIVMRGAGCTINDMWDKDFDRKVARTKHRPLASGQINYKQASAFLSLQLSAGIFMLFQLNNFSLLLGMSSLVLVALYPLFKRFTDWPQVALGLTLNWGAMLGYAAVKGYCDWSVVMPLYLSAAQWTVIYDTIYSHQDKEDDVKVGVKSTALRFGEKTKLWLSCFTAGMIPGLVMTGIACDQTWPYYVGVASVIAHLSHQIFTVDINDANICMEKFKSNKDAGLIFLTSIVTGNLLK